MAHYSTVVETFVLSLVLRDMNSFDYSSKEDTATALSDNKYKAMLAAYYPPQVYKQYKARDRNIFDYSSEEDTATALSDDKYDAMLAAYYPPQVYKRYKAGDGELAAGTNPVPTLQ